MSTSALPVVRAQSYASLDPLVEQLIADYRLSGASLCIGNADGILYRRHYGGYDDDTVLLIASATKWLSAAVLMALIDEGTLSLDATAGAFFPDAPEGLSSATLRQLFAHTSGLPGVNHGLGPRGGTLAESAERVLTMPLNGSPGEKFNYGGASMQLAGRMVEIASGRSWDDLFAEYITEPLGMKRTHFGRVVGSANPRIGAGARSSLEDYARFLQMLLSHGQWQGRRILSPAATSTIEADQIGKARRLGFVPYNLRRAPHGLYGLGVWRLSEQAPDEVGIVASPGAYGCFPWVDRTRGLYGILFVQRFLRTDPRPHEWGKPLVEKLAEIWDSNN